MNDSTHGAAAVPDRLEALSDEALDTLIRDAAALRKARDDARLKAALAEMRAIGKAHGIAFKVKKKPARPGRPPRQNR